ncbi:MAG TPA: hypothetical protein DCG19_08255 [Cryomorphaceae bacterium]|nr:hypothetical protein [Cryomorphaceae bacterium]
MGTGKTAIARWPEHKISPGENFSPQSVNLISMSGKHSFHKESVKLRSRFAQKKIVAIPDFMSPERADHIYQALQSIPEEQWFMSCFPIIESGEEKPRHLPLTPQNRLFIKYFRQIALNHYLAGQFAFRLLRSFLKSSQPAIKIETQLHAHFSSERILSFVSNIIGQKLTGLYEAFLSNYEAGDFLTWHTDQPNGTIGFVYYLTQNWDPAWGGQLEFKALNAAGLYYSHQPGYNELLLFSIGDLETIQHQVVKIADYASGNRLAYSGWFR